MTDEHEAAKAQQLLQHIEEQINKRQYSNALASTHDLAKELHRLWANILRHETRPK